jgi:glycosyltransferase involved in cell wall biosynthesis
MHSVAPKRILFVAAEALFFATHSMPIAVEAKKRGYDVHVATPDGRGLDQILATGLPWHRIVMRRGVSLARELIAPAGLVRLYRRLRPDLVYHIAVKAALYGTAAARVARVPAVVNAFPGLGFMFDEDRARTLPGRALGLAFSRVLRHPNLHLTFENAENRDIFVNRGWATAGQTTVTHGVGIRPTEYYPAPQDPDGPPLVVMAARLLNSKGVADFIDAARIVKERRIEARFALVGEPDPDNPDTITQAQLEAWRNEGTVEIWGHRGDMPAILRQAAVFCLPTFYREGIPRVLMEAGASGIPCVTTNTAGCRDIIRHGETGLLVPPRDVAALADALATLITDDGMRRRLGSRAREHVLAYFTMDRLIAGVLRILEERAGPPGVVVPAY